jgi:hypothetical protein
MSRKVIIILSAILFLVALATFTVYYLAKHHAKSVIEQVVADQSGGKLIFKAETVKLDIFHLNFRFNHPEILTKDSSNTITGYDVKAKSITINVKSLFPVLFGKLVVIDSVLIESPEIDILKYKEVQQTTVSLPEEINIVYQSLEKVLKAIKLNYLHIGSAKFTINNLNKPEEKPLQISDINLTINNFVSDTNTNDKRFLFADRIVLEVFNQDILLPDGIHRVKFKQFMLGTKGQIIKLDSCYIYAQPKDTAAVEFNVFIDSLRIKKFDFKLLATRNILKFDSALCINPDFNMKMHFSGDIKRKEQQDNKVLSRDSTEQQFKEILGNLDIGYIGVKNASVEISTEKNKKITVFKSQNDNFSISELLVSRQPDVPIQIGQFNIELRDYTLYSPESLYVAKFDRVSIQDKKIQLINFRINPTPSNHDPLKGVIKMQAFELDDIDWPVIIYENRIIAGHASLINPEINAVLPEADKNNAGRAEADPFVILEDVRKKVEIKDLIIENGLVKIKVLNGPSVFVDNCYASINVNKLLNSENAFKAIDAVDTLSFGNASFTNPSLQLTMIDGHFSQRSRSIYLGSVKEKETNQNSASTLSKVMLNGIDFQSAGDITISQLSWDKADLFMHLPTQAEGQVNKKETKADNKFKFGSLNGGPTELSFTGENFEASTHINRITTDEIVFESGQKPVINGLHLDGQLISIKQDQAEGSITDFNIQDMKTSFIRNVRIILPVNGELLSLFVPELVFSTDINQGISGKLTASFIELDKPEISFLPQKSNSGLNPKQGNSKIPLINIGRLTIAQPQIKSLPASLNGKMQIDPGNLQLNIIGINSDTASAKVDSISVTIVKPAFNSDKIKLIPSGEESIALKGKDLEFRPATNDAKASWSGNIDSFSMSGIKLNMLQNDTVKQSIAIKNLNLNHLKLSNDNLSDYRKLIQDNPQFLISNGNVAFENDKIHVKAFNLGLNKSTNSISLDSMAFYPSVDRDAFMAAKQYQSNYIQLYSGPIKVKGIDFDQLKKDTAFSATKITVNDIHFLDYKDKRLPFQHGIEKPMLTDLLEKIKVKFSVDSVVIKNSAIDYEEFNDKTQLYGKVYLTKIRGGVTGVKNYNLSESDSLKFRLFARFMDATDLHIAYEQSYTDSLSGFHLKAIASSFDLTALNPLLKPFVSAEVRRGYLDTLRMSVIGRKHVAYGTMKMYYHGLNVQYLVKGDDLNPSFKAKSISFFANRIVHTNNRAGSGDIYAERDPEKGFVNYWVKIFVGGVLTNTGVRTDKKQEKKYNQAITNYKVPPIPDIPVDY